MPVRVDRRISLQKLTEHRHDIQPPEHRAHADFQGARRETFGAGQIGHGVLNSRQAGADLTQKQLASLSQGEVAGAALKQPHPQIRFKFGHALAHRRRCQAQASRGFGETADFGAAHKAFDTAEGFHDTPL
ncbi:hypothetical protein D3C81_1729950 [compost metagenome]